MYHLMIAIVVVRVKCKREQPEIITPVFKLPNFFSTNQSLKGPQVLSTKDSFQTVNLRYGHLRQ